MLSISRLRFGLYLICILAITTSLYCLISYNSPRGLQSISIASHHHRYTEFRNGLKILQSSSQILDEIIHQTNKHYLDWIHYFRNQKYDKHIVPDNQFKVPQNGSKHELSTLIYMFENLTRICQQNLIDINERNQMLYVLHNDNIKDDNNFVNAYFDDFDYDIDFEDSDTVEYHLLNLGFDLKNIINLYRLTHPVNTSRESETSTSIQNIGSTSSYKNGFQKFSTFTKSVQLNVSSLLSEDFINERTLFTSPTIFITGISSNQIHLAIEFIRSFENFRNYAWKNNPNNGVYNPENDFVLLIYDLGLYQDQIKEIEALCNKKTSIGIRTKSEKNRTKLCQIRQFQFDNYPSHVSDLRMAAYRSIIIQEVLRDIEFTRNHINKKKKKDKYASTSTSLFWLDPQYRFINEKYNMVYLLRNETRYKSGILSWPIEQPTSALTHPRMFEYFHTCKESFYFHRMIRSGHLMISIDDTIWQPFKWSIMLPWLRCALNKDCIAPLGSQWRSTCKMDKKPHYRFSGCHHYDMSALNIVLGIAFNHSSSSQYSGQLSSRFFIPFNKHTFDYEENNRNKDQEDQLNYLEYRFEDEESSRIQGRFDIIFTDDDIQEEDDVGSTSILTRNFLFSSSPSMDQNI